MIPLISACHVRWSLAVLMAAAASGDPLSASEPAAADAESAGQAELRSLELADFRGRQWTLDDFDDQSLLVVAFLGTECPLAKLYSVRLQKLQQQYQARGVQVIAVMSNRQDSLEEIAAFARRQKLSFPVLKDPGNRFADQIGAERTPEMFVYDATRTLRYRGRIDDQYGIGYVRDQPRRDDLKIALDELLSGRDVSLDRTAAVGCIIGRQKSISDETEITFGNQVAEILNRRCVDCHREGEIAPFSLSDYDEVAGWADMIAEVVRDGRMPPWHAAEQTAEDQQSADGQNAASAQSKFINDRSMPEEEKEILYQWAEAGAPAGDLTNLPSLPDKVGGWQLPREPDQVIEINPEPFQVPAAGAVQYQYFTIDPGFEEDVWIESMELRPGNRQVVHHILVFDHPPGQRGNRGGGALGFLAGYVPGSRLAPYPPGYAKKIPAGNLLTFQVHYTPVGTPQTDQSQFGLVFADPAEITHEIATMSAVQPQLKIPPGESAYETYSQSPRLPEHAELLSFSPHMHFRGSSFLYELESPAGKRTTLLEIPEYDFNWQTNYVLRQPLTDVAGSRIVCTATFDNSKGNLNNPDPSKTVRWGDQTWEEMMIGYYHYAVPLGEPTGLEDDAALAAVGRSLNRMEIYNRIDQDNDGRLAREDAPADIQSTFKQLDANSDGVLTRKEVALSE